MKGQIYSKSSRSTTHQASRRLKVRSTKHYIYPKQLSETQTDVKYNIKKIKMCVWGIKCRVLRFVNFRSSMKIIIYIVNMKL